MNALTITKNNMVQFWDTHSISPHASWRRGKSVNFTTQQIKRLCQIVPEFTHQPILQLVPMTKQEKKHHNANGFAKLLVYKSDYFYSEDGNCVVRFCDTWFGFDGTKFGDYELLKIDITSFGIKEASEAKIRKSCGVAS